MYMSDTNYVPGTKTALGRIKVSEVTGNIMQNNETDRPVKNRFQELARLKKDAGLTARDKHLQDVAERLLRAGPSGMFFIVLINLINCKLLFSRYY